MARISRKNFELLAQKTGAENCDRFDWSYLITECCSSGHDIYGRCSLMDGQTCHYYDSIKEDKDCPSEHWLFGGRDE